MRSQIVILALVLAALLVGTGATAIAAAQSTHGDLDCDGQVTTRDNQALQRKVLQQNPLSQTQSCTPVGDAVTIQGFGEQIWGDLDCDGAISTRDNQAELRRILQQNPLSQTEPCPDVGAAIVLRGAPGPSSFDLIDADLEAGQIDEEEALLYTTFAVFGDSRLPPEYEADNGHVDDTLILQRLSAEFDGLSPETQDLVSPFMLPPSAPGSWLELPTAPAGGPSRAPSGAPISWQTFSAVGGKIKVWAQDRYPGDAEKAAGIAQTMTSTIYPELTGLMGFEPAGDAGLPNNGGDDAIDIYLIHMSDRGEMRNYASSCQVGPGYILINSARPLGNATTPGLIQTAAHEFFHVMQWNYRMAPCWHPEYRWAVEGFAKWSEDYVFPDAQSEHGYETGRLNDTNLPLDDPDEPYGTYLFPYYLSRIEGDPSLIPAIWEAFAADNNSVRAANAAIGGLGGFEEVWPKVALQNWNGEPVDNYMLLDDLQAGAFPLTDDLGDEEINLDLPIKHLAAQYYHFTVEDAVRAIEFKDNTLGSRPHISVWAIKKIGGQWQEPEDWTDERYKVFCRDMPEQDLEELVIIMANSDAANEQDVSIADEAPLLKGHAVGCTAYVGTATADVRYFQTTYHVEVQGLRFEPNEETPAGRYVGYTLVESPPVTWTASGNWATTVCTASGTMELGPATGEIADNIAYGALVIDRDEEDYFLVVNGHNFDSKVQIDCPDNADGENGWPVISIAYSGPPPDPHIVDGPEGPVLEGEYIDPAEAYGGHWRWRLVPAP
jgi:hypothetical protein